MLVAGWDAVMTKTVVNYFRKSKISSESQRAVLAEDNVPFKELKKEFLFEPVLVSENMDEASFTAVDAEVPVVQPPLSDAEIVAEPWEKESVSNDNDDGIETEDEPVYCPDRKELLQIIETMQNSPCFQKVVHFLFNLTQIMLLA